MELQNSLFLSYGADLRAGTSLGLMWSLLHDEGADDMRESRFTEAQIIGMIKELEAGMATAEVCRRHGLSAATFYKLRAKYGGMDVSDAQRLRALEDENGKLKRLLADAMLDNIVLKDLLGSKPWDATGPRTMAEA